MVSSLARKIGRLKTLAKRDLKAAKRRAGRKKDEARRKAKRDVRRAEERVRQQAMERAKRDQGRAVGSLNSLGGGLEVDQSRAGLDADERRMLGHAEQNAMMAGPVNASLKPLGAPERAEGLAYGGPRVREDQDPMEVDSMVMGHGSGEPMSTFVTGSSDDGSAAIDPLTIDDQLLGGGRDG